MKYLDRPAAWFVLVAVLFELALGVIALGIGGIFSHWPLVGVTGTPSMSAAIAIGWGMLATVPLTVTLAIVLESRLRAFDEIKTLAERLLTPLIAGIHPLELLLVSLAAGFGEEVLFRGLIQNGLARWWADAPGGWLAAWLFASLLFGLCHWLSGTYAFLATLAGLYLGLLLIVFDNLLVPITAHAMYDLAALIYLAREAADGEAGS
jgi:membrane protease YdiL (CAAX protease family)